MVKLMSQCEPGEKFTTGSQIITATDIETVARITKYDLPAFLDEKYAQSKGFKTRMAQGGLTFSVSIGLMDSSGILDDAIALVGANNIKFLAPVYAYDTIAVEIELLSKRITKDGKRGILTLKLVTKNQNGEVVAEGEHLEMFRMNPE